MIAHLCECTRKHWLSTLRWWILWYMNYVSIKNMLSTFQVKRNKNKKQNWPNSLQMSVRKSCPSIRFATSAQALLLPCWPSAGSYSFSSSSARPHLSTSMMSAPQAPEFRSPSHTQHTPNQHPSLLLHTCSFTTGKNTASHLVIKAKAGESSSWPPSPFCPTSWLICLHLCSLWLTSGCIVSCLQTDRQRAEPYTHHSLTSISPIHSPLCNLSDFLKDKSNPVTSQFRT